jgi:hypothetical protein
MTVCDDMFRSGVRMRKDERSQHTYRRALNRGKHSSSTGAMKMSNLEELLS